MNELVCIFNRKSRSDGDTDTTLLNHRTITTELCHRVGVRYTKDSIYEEILSGGTKFEERTELLRMLRDIESGLYHAVVVVELQRLARSGHLSQMIADTLEKANCLIITPTQTYDLRNKEHRLMYDMVSSLGVYELKTTDNRMRDGYITKAKAGHYVSAQAPYGYDAVWDDVIKRKYRTLVPNDRAKYVQLIFKLADEGYSLRDIKEELDKRGIRSSYGNKWYIRTLQHILNNKQYLGILVVQLTDKYTKKVSEIIETHNAFPALISVEQFIRVQLAIKSRLSGDMETRTRSRGSVKTILKDLVFCNVCNRKTGYTTSAKQKHVLVIKKCECGNRGVLEATLRERFYEQLAFVEQYWREEWNKILNGSIGSSTNNLEEKLNDLESNKNKHMARLKKLSEGFLDGLFEKTEFLENKTAITDEIANIDKSIIEVKAQLAANNTESLSIQMENRFSILDKIKNSENLVEINRLLKLIIERVYYQRESDKITIMIAPK
ncbi:recombinase family protein [Paenibacillus ehimensis]|uniref:recombinase family protein n=1 Tax=Paenibacillus ehimensis TaxID=79264 RepID=UPI002DBD0ED2|nr:recombinase family protein [Paenibacillus ehimensis]MEC0210269.1 recombinase family protein [Paenibacillus ehimensis]